MLILIVHVKVRHHVSCTYSTGTLGSVHESAAAVPQLQKKTPTIIAEVSMLYELLFPYCKIPEDADPDTPGSLSR